MNYTKIKKNLIITLISGLLSIYLEMFLENCENFNDGIQRGLLWSSIDLFVLLRICSLLLILWIVIYMFWGNYKKYLSFLYKHRYLIGGIIIVIGVFFKLSGSSISAWRLWIGGDEDTFGTILGIPRVSRGDEYALFTPFSFSQAYNYTGAYPYYSDTVRGMITDMEVVYAQPAWDFITLFRPFFWGYLLFGTERGLSFLWITKFVVLFLVTFEFSMVITQKDKWLSCLGAILIGFASVTQWWFSVNSFPEMLIFGEGAILCIYKYLKSNRYIIRIFMGLLLAYCGIGFILTFYPAWQIPLGYVYLGFIIYLFCQYKKEFVFSKKKDSLIIIGVIAIIGGVMWYFWTKSGVAIESIMNTSYPGKRIERGGGSFKELFIYSLSLFLPLSTENLAPFPFENETAQFFLLFPMGLLMSIAILIKDKIKDKMLLILLIVEVFLLLYCIIPLPQSITKLLMLGYSTPHRTIAVIGYLSVWQLLRTIKCWQMRPRKLMSGIISVFIASCTVITTCKLSGNYMKVVFCIFLWVVVLFSVYFLLRVAENRIKKYFILFFGAITVISGCTINPLQQGCDIVYEHPLIKKIEEITKENEGLWLVEASYPITNIPIMVGAPTINSTNVYPALERWALLDKDGSDYEIYNRYAHISVELTESETEFFPGSSPDQFLLKLNYDDLKILNVKYILSMKNYEEMSNEMVKIEQIAQVGNYYIYKVN